MDIVVGAAVGLSILAGAVVIAPTVKFSMNIAPYIYTNTRCSAKTGLILNKRYYEQLLNTTNVSELHASLEDTGYASIVEQEKDFKNISNRLSENMFDTYNWLISISPNDIKPMLSAIKQKYEIDDLKEIVNSLKDNNPIGELKHVHDPELKIKLEGVKDFSSFIAILEETSYKAIFNNKTLEEISEINNSLDKFYFENVFNIINKCKDQKAGSAFKDYWRFMIDLVNIRVVLRKLSSKQEHVDLIAGGMIKSNDLSAVNDNAQLENTIQSSVYSEFIYDMDFFSIENALFRSLKKLAGNIAAKNTLKSGAVIKFIILKELEVRNLNILLKLKSEGLDIENIEKLMVI